MSVLPAPLAPWHEALSGLNAGLAMSLGPMLHVLDDLVGRLDEHGGDTGEPDGYDGTTNRGDIGRLLIDEWLLAQEVPDEFLRRAAENQLSYLRLARRREAPRGRTVAVVDCGPEQWGAGRLVQLAALAVLHRRAEAIGSRLVLRLLPDGRVVEGGLTELLPQWLRARSTANPSREQVEAAVSADDDDHVWLLAGPTTRSLVPSHRRTVSSWVTGWQEGGADEVTARVGNATARLALPDGRVAVAALRGEGLLRRKQDATVTAVPTTGRGAVFGSADSRLLWRGSGAGEVLGCFVGSGGAPRVRRYVMGGAVLAAASLGKRVVAAVTDGNAVWVEVVGKKLSRVDRVHVSLAGLGLDANALDSVLDQPLRPLFLHGGNIVLEGARGWWSLDGGTATHLTEVVAVAPGSALDTPRLAFRHERFLHVDEHRWPFANLAAGPLLGPPDASWCTWSEDTRVWRVVRTAGPLREIAVDEDDRVVGVTVVGGEPSLIVVSPSGRMLRQVSQRHVKTWTRWAGPAHFSLHPVNPWLARTTPDAITVGDLATGETLLDVRTDA